MRKLVLISLIVALIIVPMSCGKPEAKEDSYEEFVAEYYQTKLALHMLQNRYDGLEVSYNRLKGRDAEYINAVNALKSENQALQIEVALIRGLWESRKGELESTLNELITLRAEKQKWHIFATKEYDAILTKYNSLRALYPPSHFANKDALVKWRASVGKMARSLELQRMALKDGYIVSVSADLNYCVAVAGGVLYKITPRDKELVEKIGKVE